MKGVRGRCGMRVGFGVCNTMLACCVTQWRDFGGDHRGTTLLLNERPGDTSKSGIDSRG
jgi:hypothetical protein